jgi:hypothetical protein
MKRLMRVMIALCFVVSFALPGFADSERGKDSKNEILSRISALEKELAALKALVRNDEPVSKTAKIPGEPGSKSGPKVFLDGTRGWDEDGTNMWTAAGALPNYNVGIGTNTPWTKLEVAGHIRADGGPLTNMEVWADCSSNPAWDYAGIAFSIVGSYYPATRLQTFGPAHSPAYEFHIRHYPNAPIIISTNNTERMRIAGNGNVGIGNPNPAYRLDVTGDIALSGGVYDGASFGLDDYVLVADGLGGVAWEPSPAGQAGDYIWNQYIAPQSPASWWIDGKGRVSQAAPAASDTALIAISNDPGRRGVYGECYAYDGGGVGITGVGGYFGTASWYAPSAGNIGGVLGTYWGEGVWGLSQAASGGYTGVWGEGRDAGCTGVCGSGNGIGLSYWGGAGVSGCSDDVGTFGYGNTTSASFGVLGRSDATNGIGSYGISALATMFIPPTGQDAGLFAAGKYYGLYGMGQRQLDHGIGVVGMGDSTTTIIYSSGAGVVGCGAVGVMGAVEPVTYGILGYSAIQANYCYHSENPANGDNQSSIYAYRTRSSANDGISYSYSGTNDAVQGYSYWGDVYTFGVSGHNYNDYTRCGGVLGANSSGTYWGSLGYKTSGSVTYGGYFTSTGTGGGKLGSKSGIGFGAYGSLLGGWARGEEYGFYAQGRQYALYLNGNSFTNGYLASLQEGRNGINVLYSLVSPSVTVLCYGRATLSAGLSSVQFPESFTQSISEDIPIAIIATPIGEANDLYVANISGSGFSLKESGERKSNAEFSWIAIGVRKGYGDASAPQEILERSFDSEMSRIAFDENNLAESAQGLWHDGATLRFGNPPQQNQPKSPEEANLVKQDELRNLETKLIALKEQVRRLEEGLEGLSTRGDSRGNQ